MWRSRSWRRSHSAWSGATSKTRRRVAGADVALADVGQLDAAAILVEQPRGAGEGDELARAAERVLQPGREQLLDRELGDELVEAEALALVDRAQEAVGVAEARGWDRTHGPNLANPGRRGLVPNVSVRPGPAASGRPGDARSARLVARGGLRRGGRGGDLRLLGGRGGRLLVAGRLGLRGSGRRLRRRRRTGLRGRRASVAGFAAARLGGLGFAARLGGRRRLRLLRRRLRRRPSSASRPIRPRPPVPRWWTPARWSVSTQAPWRRSQSPTVPSPRCRPVWPPRSAWTRRAAWRPCPPSARTQ